MLRAHQHRAVDAILAGVRDGERCCLVSACGTGKTLTSADVSRQVAPADGVLCLVPTVELLAQTVREWAGYLGRSAGRVIAVCNEYEVRHAGWGAAAALTGLDVLVTTNPGRLAAELVGRVTVVSTYASLPVIQAAHATHGAPAWRLVVIDEAHRTAGREGKAWAAVHHDYAVPAAKRLYMTATPRIVTGKGPTISMDDEKIFGPVAHRLTFAEAIELRLLADYRLVVGVVTDAELAALTDRTVFTVDGRSVPARMLAAQIALGRAIGEYGLRRVISYHNRVAAATRFAITLPAALSLLPQAERGGRAVAAWSVSGRSTPQHRRLVLDNLRDPGDRTVLAANAKVFGEGIDVPALDGVMFVDPRMSTVDAVQGVGRGLRIGDDPDKVATILVPVLTTEDDLAAERFDAGWEAVWQLVRALRAHDERIDTRLERVMTVSRSKAAAAASRELPWLAVTGAPVPANFADRVQLKAARILDGGAWQESYEAAAAFYAEHGHLQPPDHVQHRTPSGYPLGKWLNEQRNRYRQGLLTPERVALLEQIAMVWDPEDAAWQTHFNDLRAWRTEHGDATPPPPLRNWLTRQRVAYQSGRLTPERTTALQSLGVDLTPKETGWKLGLDHARQYRAKHGDLHVPGGWQAPDGYKLGPWIARQRDLHRSGRLAAERVAALDALGMIWDANEHRWQEGLTHARAYHATHGDLHVLKTYVAPGGFRLGTWVDFHRQRHAAGRLSADRTQTLERLGVNWYRNAARTEPSTPPTTPSTAPVAPVVHFTEPPKPPEPWTAPATPAVLFLPPTT
ncbi:DEAD/DEAH box helicase [Phytohabitans kaempferiae]|uniref:DEAD/DEAH box helicase n=1 Tax=Phytohabitans kaempferiae TaxID=1620943 RepID=UPI003670F5BD